MCVCTCVCVCVYVFESAFLDARRPSAASIVLTRAFPTTSVTRLGSLSYASTASPTRGAKLSTVPQSYVADSTFDKEELCVYCFVLFCFVLGSMARYSLPSRDLIADCVETMHEGYSADALITLAGCDKTNPGLPPFFAFGCGEDVESTHACRSTSKVSFSSPLPLRWPQVFSCRLHEETTLASRSMEEQRTAASCAIRSCPLQRLLRLLDSIQRACE